MSAAALTLRDLVRALELEEGLDCEHPDAGMQLMMYGSHCGEFWCGDCGERCVPRKRCPCCRAVLTVGRAERGAVLMRELACDCGWATRECAA